MSQPTSPNATRRESSPVRSPDTPQMRAVRKELLLLRSEVERAEFLRARFEMRAKFERFGWLKVLLPRMPSLRAKGPGKGVHATLSEWMNHPIAASLASLLLAKPIRSKLAAGAKPLLKWGTVGAVAAWAGYSLLARMARRSRAESEASEVESG
jgi:Protein of unknown function (DUF3318)